MVKLNGELVFGIPLQLFRVALVDLPHQLANNLMRHNLELVANIAPWEIGPRT